MHRTTLAVAIPLVALAVAIAGCDSGNLTRIADSARQQAAVTVATRNAKHQTIDDDFADIASQAPGFGGLFYDSSGTMNVYLVDPTRMASANVPISSFVQRRQWPAGREVKVLRGQFDYRDLMRSYQAMRSAASIFTRGSGLVSTDIDERRNRIVVGVQNEAARQRVLAALSNQPAVMSGAVLVEIVPVVEINSTLQWYQEPDEGGEQIGSRVGICTNGFNAYKVVNGAVDSTSGHRYFITASHCTDRFGIVDSMTMGQPDTTVPKGHEVADPPLLTHATNMYCPAGRYCRWSDAAVFEYIGYIGWKWPYILKVCSGITICGSTVMQVEAVSSAVGTNVQAMGRTSGWRSGTVQNTCIDEAEFENGFDTGRTMLCQEMASFVSNPGDSGGPVYRSDGEYRATGILWGGNSSSSVYSPIGGLQADGLSYTTALQSSLAP